LKEDDARLVVCALRVDDALALAAANPMTKFLLLVIDIFSPLWTVEFYRLLMTLL